MPYFEIAENSVIYERRLEAKPNGDTVLYLTEERNGYLLFLVTASTACLIHWFRDYKDSAIEQAVKIGLMPINDIIALTVTTWDLPDHFDREKNIKKIILNRQPSNDEADSI